MPYELAEADQKDQIVITLHESAGRDLSVRSVDLFISAMKVRFSAQAVNCLERIFHSDVAEMVRGICRSATLSKQIINVPDFNLRFRGLAIRGYTLLVHTMEDGLRQFIVRLKRGIGNALALFRPWEDEGQGLSIVNASFENSSNQVSPGRLFDEMLAHLYLPLVNMNNYLRQALEGQRENGGQALATSIVQLKTKAEVLQFAFDRLISELMLEKYAGTSDVQVTTQPVFQIESEPAPLN